MSDDTAQPNYTRPEAKAATAKLELVHDLLAGTDRMWDRSASGAGGVPYIAKWKDEDTSVYDIRRKCETLFEGLGRTLNAGVGMLFAKPPAITWNASESAMATQWANLDGAGTAGPVLIKRHAEFCIRDGLGAIVVDHPPAPIDPETKAPIPINAANEAEFGLRPTWALYQRGQIINWRTATVNNRRVLSLIVFAETAEEEAGLFGIACIPQYRVLRLVLTPAGYQAVWEVYRMREKAQTDDPDVFYAQSSGGFRNRNGQLADFLPVSVAYAGRTDAPCTATVPLMGVAWANLAHWQQSTDLRFYRKLAAFPQPVVVGELAAGPNGQPGTLRWGPMVGIQLANGGSYDIKELTGSSMTQLENGIKEKLAQMGQLGLSFLVSDTRAAETAEAKRLDATAQNSTLATAAQGIEDGVNQALEYHAWYLGIEKAGAPVLAISRDYESTAMDAGTMAAYTALVNAGFPKMEALQALQAGSRIRPDANLELLAMEWETGEMAIREAKAQAQADALAGNIAPPDPETDDTGAAA